VSTQPQPQSKLEVIGLGDIVLDRTTGKYLVIKRVEKPNEEFYGQEEGSRAELIYRRNLTLKRPATTATTTPASTPAPAPAVPTTKPERTDNVVVMPAPTPVPTTPTQTAEATTPAPAELPTTTQTPVQQATTQQTQPAPETPETSTDSEAAGSPRKPESTEDTRPFFRELATAALARGETRIVPVEVAGDKNASVRWSEMNVNTATAEEWAPLVQTHIEQMTRKFPRENAGVIAKPDEVCFVDCDTYKEFIAGYKAFSGEKFPESYTTSARENRAQIHFKQTDATRALGNVIQFAVDGIDLSFRQNNYYVLVEGSRHPSGSIYQAVVKAPIIPMPDKMVEYIQHLDAKAPNRAKPREAAGAGAESSSSSSAATFKSKAPDFVQKLAANDGDFETVLAGVPEITAGYRDNYLASILGKLHNFGWSDENLKSVAKRINTERCVPPLDDPERIAKSVARYPILKIGSAPKPAAPAVPPAAPTPTVEEIVAEVPGTKPEEAEVIAEAVAKGLTVEQAKEMVENVQPPLPPPILTAAEQADPKKYLEEVYLAKPDVQLEDEKIVALISLLKPLEYDKLRKEIAKRMGVRADVLDNERRKSAPKTPTEEDEEVSNIEALISTPLPWDEPVDITDVLDDCEAVLLKYMHFKRHDDAAVVSLWIAQTYTVDEQREFPYLGVRSPTFGCGKTTCLELTWAMSNRGLMAANLTSAAAFRVVDEFHPTLFIDELDTFIHSQADFVGILNNGHKKKGGSIIRVIGENHDRPKAFAVYGPKAYGMIGAAPSTFASRSIPIILETATKSDNLTPLPKVPQDIDELDKHLHTIARKFARWAKDNAADIRAFRPNMSGLINRSADNWYPLVRIAEMAGEKWTEKAIGAAGTEDPFAKPDIKRLLLIDIRNILYTRKVEMIEPRTLLHDLHEQATGWNEFGRLEKPLSAAKLSDMLEDFGIRSTRKKTSRSGESKVIRVYRLEDMTEAFDRFISDTVPEEVDLSSEITQSDDEGETETISDSSSSSRLDFGPTPNAGPEGGRKSAFDAEIVRQYAEQFGTTEKPVGSRPSEPDSATRKAWEAWRASRSKPIKAS
jgi:putative DNA primase/helicase